jgi:endonuclease III-like uncharacterized protein
MVKQTVNNPWASVVMAMLSTGGYSLKKIFQNFELLEENGLTDIRKIACMDEEDLSRKLVKSGYNRGPILTKMYTDRLISLGKLSSNIEENERVLNDGTKDEISSLLMGVKGIGPVVIETFLNIR